MNRSACVLSIAAALLVLLSLSPAQVPTGTPAFGSFGGGPFDVVNLGNLNSHFDINVRTKAGRVTPFTYDITYDTSIWYPSSVNGVQTWQPVAGYGWNFPLAATGSLTSQIVQTGSQPCDPPSNMTMISFTVYAYYVYTDPKGQTHPINTGFLDYENNDCGLAGAGGTTTAADGSGYVLTLANGSGAETVTGANGMVYLGTGTISGAVTDSNGNEITTNNGVFTDTLGQTSLTVTGTNPIYLEYAAPSGATAKWAINYTSYNIETNFGCSGIAEYTKSGAELPTSITQPDGKSYTFTYENTEGHSGYTTGRLSSVTLPTGGSVTYTYPTTNSGANNGINCTDGSAPAAASGNPSLTRTVSPGGTWTYYRTDVSGNHWQTKITSPPDSQNSGSVGDDTVIDFQQDSSTATYGNTHNFFETQRVAYQGSQGSGTVLSTTITCYNTAGPTPANCPTTSVSTPITRVTAFPYLPNTSGRVSETDTQYSEFSNPAFPSEIDSYDYGTTAGSVGSLIRKVFYTWTLFGNSSNPTIGLTGAVVEDASSNVHSSLSYSYNQTVTATTGTPQHTTAPGSRANLTSIQEEITGGSSPTYLYRVFTYYDTGMLNTTTDWGKTSSGGSNVTTYNYSTASFSSEDTTQSCGNSFITSISEPLSLSRSFTWDCFGGVQTSTTDENGQVSTVYYNQTSSYGSPDPDYWRPYAYTDQLNNPTTLTYPTETAIESALLFNSNNSVVDQRIKVDGFGRVILNQMKEGPTSSTYDSTQTDFDVFNRVSKNYLPFTNAADTDCSGSCPGIVTAYDALNRPLTVTDGGGGTTTYTYTNNDVYQAVGPAPSGEHTKRKQLQYDGLGRLSSVCEITSVTGSGTCSQVNSQTGFWTEYTYDVLGDTIGVTQNAQAASSSQQTRTYTFDMAGRNLTEQNPETGSITYVYDSWDASCGVYTSAGDLVEKKDAIGNVTCMKYDALHRMTQTTYPSGSYASVTPAKCYVYDSATVNSQTMVNAKGRMAEAYTTSSSHACTHSVATVDEGFSYTARGQISDVWEETPNSGGFYHVNATYWAHGRLDVLNGGTSPLPGLPAITYGLSSGTGLDGKGRITAVAAASGQNPASSISWNPGNQVTGITLGSGDSDAYQYDSNTGRMTQYTFNMGTGPTTQTGVLTWNANWTLGQLQITDQINTANSQTCTYSHDDLTRIISVGCGSVWAQTFSLDPFGNLSKSGSATFQPTYTGATGTSTSPTNQYYSLTGGSSGVSNYYDTNGNLTNDVTNTYTWDADGNMLSVGGSTTVSLVYDAFDRMVEQDRSSADTEVVYGPYGMKLALMNGQTLVNAFVKLPGKSRVVYNSSGLAYYRHADHLGNSRLATTPSQTKYYDVAYAPYGENYNGSGTTADLAFTDQNQDTAAGGWASNLYDFMFREYRTAHGRWTKPDPAGMSVVDPTNPQTWNRYAYVLNNPMAMVDLLGDDGCYNSNGDDLGVDQMNCYSAGGVWLGGQDVIVDNGQVYVTNTVAYSGDSNGAVYTYTYNQWAGSFNNLFGYLFQGVSPIANPSIPNGNADTCPGGNCGGGSGGGSSTQQAQQPQNGLKNACHNLNVAVSSTALAATVFTGAALGTGGPTNPVGGFFTLGALGLGLSAGIGKVVASVYCG